MFKYLIATYCFMLCIYEINAQQSIQGTVLNKNGKAISFASVSTLNGAGTTCDSLGNFNITLHDNTNNDKLFVRSLGYVTDTFLLAENKTNLKFYLNPNRFNINEVAVVSHQNIKSKSAVSAFSTSKKEITQLNPQNVNQVLQTKAGFTNRFGYQAPLTLRGMSGNRVLILRNGNRRFSSYPAGVMSHTINVYDLERIEVEKGAASVIYGAGAMAGIINLIDKSPFKQNKINGKITTGYGAVNNEKNLLACGGWSDGKYAIKAGFRYRNADNFTYSDGTIAENSFYTDKDLFLTTGYQFSELNKIILTIDIHYGGPWGKPVGFNGTEYMRVQTKKENSNNYSIKYKNGKWGIFSNTEISAFYSNEYRSMVKNYYTAAGYHLSYVETTNFSDYYFGGLLKSNIKINSKYIITTGAEVYSFHISTPTDFVDYIEEISYKNRVSHNAHSITSGIFIHNVFKFNNKLNGSFGIRYNYASVYEGDVHSYESSEGRNDKKNALSGNISLMYLVNPKSKLKINLARSFRMPETTEMYTDNYTSNGVLYGNPDLEAEFCNSLDLSYQFTSKIIDFEVSPFLWVMNDMITKEEKRGLPGTNYTYVNIGKTRMYGGEFNIKLKYNDLLLKNDKIVARLGLSYLNGTDLTETKDLLKSGSPLDYVPPFNLKSDINYNWSIRKKLNLHATIRSVYYAEQKRLGEDSFATPKYFLLGCNLGISHIGMKTKPSLNIAINNLLNKEYYCYQSYIPSEGRDIRIFLTFNF